MAVKRALWTEPTPIGAGVVADCGPTPAPIVADLLIAAAGVGLVVFSLNVAPPSPLRRIVLIAIVAALWGAVAYGWLPHNPQNCVN